MVVKEFISWIKKKNYHNKDDLCQFCAKPIKIRGGKSRTGSKSCHDPWCRGRCNRFINAANKWDEDRAEEKRKAIEGNDSLTPEQKWNRIATAAGRCTTVLSASPLKRGSKDCAARH